MVSGQLALHKYATGRQARVITAMTLFKQHLFKWVTVGWEGPLTISTASHAGLTRFRRSPPYAGAQHDTRHGFLERMTAAAAGAGCSMDLG